MLQKLTEKADGLVIRMRNMPKPLKASVSGFAVSVYCALMTAMPAFAGTDTSSAISDGVYNGAEQIFNILVAIVAPIAAIAFGICGVKLLVGGTRAADEAKSTAIRVVIGIALVLMAPSIIYVVKNWFSESSFSQLK